MADKTSPKRRSVQERLKKQFRGQLTTAGQVRNTFEAKIPAGVPLEKVISGSYWWPVNGQIRALDLIDCTWEDGSRIVRLRVMGRDDRSELIHVLVTDDQEFPAPDDLPPGFRLDYASPGTGWQVFREGQTSAIAAGFATAYEAAAWLRGDTAAAGPAPAGDEADDGAKGPKGGDKPAPKLKPGKPAEAAQPPA